MSSWVEARGAMEFWVKFSCSVLIVALLPVSSAFITPLSTAGHAGRARLPVRAGVCLRSPRICTATIAQCKASASAEAGNQVQLAIAKCREAVEGNPQNEEAWFYLGVMLQETGAYPDAMTAFQNSVKLNPRREDAWLNIGLMHEAFGNKPLALQAFMGAINSNPNSANAYVRLGMLMDSAGKDAAAVSAYEKALSIQPDAVATHSNLVKLLIKYNKLDSARMAAQRGVEACPESSVAHAALGAAFIELNRAREGVRSLKRAVELDPEDAEAHNGLGVGLRALRRMGEAEESYKTAIRLQPTLAEPHYNLALLYRDQGPLYADKAIAALKTTIALSPGNYAAELLLAALSTTFSSSSSDGAGWIESSGGLPARHVVGMFDAVATTYEEEVLPALRYSAPKLLLQALATATGQEREEESDGSAEARKADEMFPGGRGVSEEEVEGLLGTRELKGLQEWKELGDALLRGQAWRVADVGCGSGCCGWALQGAEGGVLGCDLSKGMVERAAASGVYESVEQQEAATFLTQQPQASLDLVIAADVLPYIWDVSHLLAGAEKALKEGGRLALTTEEPLREATEEAGGALVVLNRFARVCHAEEAVRGAAAAARLEVEEVRGGAIRMQGSRQVLGKAFVLRKPTSSEPRQ